MKNEHSQELLALLKLLALGNQDIERGRVACVEEVVARLRGRQNTKANDWTS